MNPNTYAVIAFDGISPFHLSVPCIVFRANNKDARRPDFDTRVCAAESGMLNTSAGFAIQPGYTLGDLHDAHTVIVPSWRNTSEMPPLALLDALRAAHKRGSRIVGLCLGSFVLAAAGLLDGRPATTHWHWADELASRYPTIKVNPDVLYIDDGDIVTSAGSAAAIDCCLHLVRRQHGAEIANHIARMMVVPPYRQGGQAQYIEQPAFLSQTPDRISQLLEWMLQHLDIAHGLDELSGRAMMSRRTFTRKFRQMTGTTVGAWLLNQRLAQAQRLLETTDKPIELIAEISGFASPALFRRSFMQAYDIKPSAYRKTFRGT